MEIMVESGLYKVCRATHANQLIEPPHVGPMVLPGMRQVCHELVKIYRG